MTQKKTIRVPVVGKTFSAVLKRSRSTRDFLFVIFLFLLLLLYYPLYNFGIGVTGLPGMLPYHLSGGVHYLRAYLLPIIMLFFLSKTSLSFMIFLAVLIYAAVAGVAASSRFVALLPVFFIIIFVLQKKQYGALLPLFLYCLFIWFFVTASRDLTFNGGSNDLLNVLYYSLMHLPLDNIISVLDLMTGRLSGAQQVVLVHQFRGDLSCISLTSFLFGGGSVCQDTAGTIYGLSLEGTSYGLGISLIPSIIVSSGDFLDYVVPTVFVVLLLHCNQKIYSILRIENESIAMLYLFVSVLFLYMGQINFYYYIQIIAIVAALFRNKKIR